MDTTALRDDPRGRLRWQAPAAVLLTTLGLMAFLRMLQPPGPAPEPGTIEIAVAEISLLELPQQLVLVDVELHRDQPGAQ